MVPGRSELLVPMVKDEEVNTLCVQEGTSSDNGEEDLRVVSRSQCWDRGGALGQGHQLGARPTDSA